MSVRRMYLHIPFQWRPDGYYADSPPECSVLDHRRSYPCLPGATSSAFARNLG
jgi:hypothetical protein